MLRLGWGFDNNFRLEDIWTIPGVSVVHKHSILSIKYLLDEELEPLLGEAPHVQPRLSYEGHLEGTSWIKISRENLKNNLQFFLQVFLFRGDLL